METKQSCCWGILGAADIVRKNWQAIYQTGNGYLKAIASRNRDRAAALIDDCQNSVPVQHNVDAVEGYENLLADPEIHAVYIPLPTGIRDQWTMAAIEAGKHVMIEKPCSLSANKLKTIIESAVSKNLQVMDGVMFAHSSRFGGLMDAIHGQRVIGNVRRIVSQFSFFGGEDWAQDNIRCKSHMEPFGALGDLGWYCIRIIMAAMGDAMPEQVTGHAIQTYKHADADGSVPIEFEGTLLFSNHVSASMYCSFVTQHQQWTHISGTEGFISIDDFTLPYSGRKPRFEIVKSEFVTDGCDFNMHRNNQLVEFEESANSAADSQETRLFRDFNECVLSGTVDSEWPKMSLNTQIVLDALMQSAMENQRIVAING